MGSANVLNLPRRRKTVRKYLEIVRFAQGKNQGLVSVASHFGISPATVINASRAFGMSYDEIKQRKSMPLLKSIERQLTLTTDVDQRTQKIVEMYNSEATPTMEEIGRKVGLTRQRVHQIIKEATKKGLKVARRKPTMGHWIERCRICRQIRKLATKQPLMITRRVANGLGIPIWKVHWHLNKLKLQELVPRHFGHFRSERIIEAIKLYNQDRTISAWKLGRKLGYKNLPAVFRGLRQRGFGYLLLDRIKPGDGHQHVHPYSTDFSGARPAQTKTWQQKTA